MAEEQEQGNVRLNLDMGRLGMNMDNTPNQINQGVVTYALNAAVENFDANSVNYQNEPGNELCFDFPEGYQLIGRHFIQEKNKHVFFITNPDTGASEIGYMDNNDCIYRAYINADCLNFNIDHPIHKSVHKITNCSTQIYWTDGLNPRRYIDLDSPPWITKPGTNVCDNELVPGIVDCNKIKVQPNYDIPQLEITEIRNGGDLKAGAYQFAIQYCDARGGGYTSYHSVTNPTPIANTFLTTPNFDYLVGRSIVLKISNIDITGYYEYFNIAVIKTTNAITSVELIGTYFIDDTEKNIIYTGQNVTNIRLSINDIFEKFPFYDVAQDVTAVRDVLVWDNLTSNKRVNYQQIANQIELQWETWRIPSGENYADELNATNLRGYLRDEVYAFEIVFLLRNGRETDGFHIPGRAKNNYDTYPDVPNTNNDFIGTPEYYVAGVGYIPYWKVYNTGYKIGDSPGKNVSDPNYKGPWEYGGFSYWESTEVYPCNELVWGNLANQPIRHHKFPDLRITPIHENPVITYQNNKIVPVMTQDAIYPIGVRVDSGQILGLIGSSTLTKEQKEDIVGYKIVRGDRGTNKSIVAKGILRNVGKYERESTEYYYPNYPYNDLNEDPFILDKSNSYSANAFRSNASGNICRSFTIFAGNDEVVVEYTDCSNALKTRIVVPANENRDICAIDFPKPTIVANTSGVIARAYIQCNTYKRYKIRLKDDCVRSVQTSTIPIIFGINVYPPRHVGKNSPYYINYLYTQSNLNSPFGPPPAGYSSWPDYLLYGYAFDPNINSLKLLTSPIIIWDAANQYVGQEYYVDSMALPVPVDSQYSSIVSAGCIIVEEVESIGYEKCNPFPLDGFKYPDSAYRMVFNSPETSFGQPFLGDIIKLETVMFGAGQAHFVEVEKNAMYKLLTREAQEDALSSSAAIANAGGFDAAAMFTTYQAYLTIYINGITRRNYAYSFNSIANYDYWAIIENNQAVSGSVGIKQRPLTISQYLIPGVQNVGDDANINNFQRESSVYLKTDTSRTALPFPNQTPSLLAGSTSLISDNTRFTIGDSVVTRGTDCANPGKLIDTNVVSYYGSLKNEFVNQWGQMYSYDTIDTGFQRDFSNLPSNEETVFGGDTFINRFAFKTKLPFFIDNRVGAPDDSDIFYDEIGNVAYPRFWHSARSVLSNFNAAGQTLNNIISFKANTFDCPNEQTPGPPNPGLGRTYYDGRFYLFAYGIPNFYCETSINVDLRQAFNNKEGDFWPHVSTSIPDEWLQESNVTIAQDNTYYYNVSFSKQNKENNFTHLPVDWDGNQCFTYYPFRAIYSDVQQDFTDNSINSWLIYRPVSFFDFPQNYGNLTSLDGIQNKNVLARFENKTLLYNNLLTIDTSNPQAAYIGNDKLFASAPPIDFAETDLGYVGSQHKFLLKIPQGQVTIDAKRGNVFLLTGEGAKDLAAFGSGMNRFFTDHLAFEILRYFPKVNVDNHFKNIGLHGVYDSKYDRIIITKLDYVPLLKNIIFDEADQEFYLVETVDGTDVKTQIYVTDEAYFCNKGWSVSFNFNTMSWISFHSYQPNWFIGENNFFYSGLNGSCYIDAFAGEVLDNTTTTSTTTTMYYCTCIRFINFGDTVQNIEYIDCEGNLTLDSVLANDFLDVCGKDPDTLGSPTVIYYGNGPCTFLDPLNDTWYCYNTSTSTDPVISPCALIGFAVDITPEPGPTTTSTTSSTSSTSSTTTTTTTICPNCFTVRITNATNCEKYLQLTSCDNFTQTYTVPAYGSIHECVCSIPVIPDGFVADILSGDCNHYYCYTFTNNGAVDNDVLYIPYTTDPYSPQLPVTVSVGPSKSVCVCAFYGSPVTGSEDVIIEGGTLVCNSDVPSCGECADVCDPGVITATFGGDCECLTFVYSVAAIPAGATHIRWIIPPTGTIIEKTDTSITVKYPYGPIMGYVIVYGVTPCGTLGPSSSLSIMENVCTTTTTTCAIGGSSQVYISNNNTEGKGDSQILYADLDGNPYNVWSTPDLGTDPIPLNPGETYTGTQNIGGINLGVDVRQDEYSTSFLKTYVNCTYIGCEIIPNGTGNIVVNTPILLNPTDSIAVVLDNNPVQPFVGACSCDFVTDVLVVNNAYNPAEAGDTNINTISYSGAPLYSVTAGSTLPIVNFGYSAGTYDTPPYSTGSVDVDVKNDAPTDRYISVYVNCVLVACRTVAAASGDTTYNFTTDLNIGDKLVVYYSSTPC